MAIFSAGACTASLAAAGITARPFIATATVYIKRKPEGKIIAL